MQREGIHVVDGQALMSEARVIKTQDEITLLNMSAMTVDAAYDELYRMMKPGLSENKAGPFELAVGQRNAPQVAIPSRTSARRRLVWPMNWAV